MSDTGVFKALTLVKKPEGHELAHKRAAKKDSATEWFPKDALYSASKMLEGKEPAKALLVAWYEMDGDTQRLEYRLFCETPNDGTALGADIFQRLSRHD